MCAYCDVNDESNRMHAHERSLASSVFKRQSFCPTLTRRRTFAFSFLLLFRLKQLIDFHFMRYNEIKSTEIRGKMRRTFSSFFFF